MTRPPCAYYTTQSASEPRRAQDFVAFGLQFGKPAAVLIAAFLLLLPRIVYGVDEGIHLGLQAGQALG